MKTEQEILDRIDDEVNRLSREAGHEWSITRGWIDALEWVLETDQLNPMAPLRDAQ